MKEQCSKWIILCVAVTILVLNCPGAATFDNAFDSATGHWVFNPADGRLNDNNAPGTTLGFIWAGEFPWGDASNGFTNDKDGFVHMQMGGVRRLFVSSAAAATELKFSESITTWTRFKWDGGAATPIGRLMGTPGGSPNWGWNLGIPGSVYSGSATRASFYISSDGSTTLKEATVDYAFAVNTWYDVAGTFDHTTGDVSVYVFNPYTGALLASDTVPSTLTSLNTPAEEFRIMSNGYEGATQYVDIESAAVWGSALTQGQIQNLTNVPEPATLLLLSAASIGLFTRRRRS